MTDEQNQKLIRMRRAGFTLLDIAKEFNVSVPTACQLCKFFGVKRGQIRHSREFEQQGRVDQKMKIYFRSRQGESKSSIARSAGISRERVRQICAEVSAVLDGKKWDKCDHKIKDADSESARRTQAKGERDGPRSNRS